MRNTAYAGPGVEIEEDIVRLRRRRTEYEGDAARSARRAGRPGRRRRTLAALARALPAAIGRRR